VWDPWLNRGKGYVLRQIQVERRGSISKQMHNSRLSRAVISQSRGRAAVRRALQLQVGGPDMKMNFELPESGRFESIMKRAFLVSQGKES